MILEFNEKDLQLIDQAVQQMPFYLAAPLIQKINEQIQNSKNTATIPAHDTGSSDD